MLNNSGQTIAMISDTGAYKYKPLFIAGSTIMVVLLDLGMLAERWLRHTGDLLENTSWWQKALSIIAIIASIAGAAGIILLSCFDTYRHPKLHDKFLILFLAGYVISAIFICAEYQRLGVKYRRHPVLAASFWMKLAFIIIEIALAIRKLDPDDFALCRTNTFKAFGIFETKNDHQNAGAILEWTIAFVFTGYILSFVMDLLPAVRSKHHVSNETVAEMGSYGGPNGYTNGYVGVDGHTGQATPVTRNF
jgi:hypothetical protein